MILFDLKCAEGHLFEHWFASGSEKDAQLEASSIACPECGDRHVSKAISAPRINSGAAAPVPAVGLCGLPACGMGGCQAFGE